VTRAVVASAPGKIVLSGEYAVLDGAPAILMAVDRRARAAVAALDGNISQVRAPGYSNEVGRFEISDGDIRWHAGRALFGVIDSVLRAANAMQAGARLIDLDTSEFIDAISHRKIGIGSSAALTVALCAAIKESIDIGTIMNVAQQAHADLQGGVGSGADVACSLSGGLIEYRREGTSASAVDWPEGLSYRVIWTGVPASTRDKLAKLNAGKSMPSRDRLVSTSERLASAWRSGDADRIISQFRGYNEQLRQFSIDHGLGIFDAGHEELWRAADDVHLVYKPCGAGGGDVGIVFGTDDAELDSFVEKMASGHVLLDCKQSRVGVTIEAAKEDRHE
jgi:phosphomevalonate kinase